MVITKEEHDGTVNGIHMLTEGIVANLQIATKTLDDKFPGLNLISLPEHDAAIDAVRKYGEAIVRRMNEEYENGG